jgi:hypothetical protein
MESPGGLDELSLEKSGIRREHVEGQGPRIDLPKDRVDLSKDCWLLQEKLRLDKRLEFDLSCLLKQKCVCLC